MRGEVNKLKILIALIIFFQGFSIGLLSHPLLKTSPWFRILGWLMMIGGVLYIYILYRSYKLKQKKAESEKQSKESMIIQKRFKSRQKQIDLIRKSQKIEEKPVQNETNLLTNFMDRIIKNTEKFSHLTLPIVGAVIIDAVIIYNIWINNTLNIGSWDTITILFGASLIAYNYIPESFAFARDFFIFFMGLLFLILIFPTIFSQFLIGSEGSAEVIKILLSDPVVSILNLGGIESQSEIIIESGNKVSYVYFPLKASGQTAGVGIGDACSGIYSASIFLAAFITFVAIEYKKFNIKVGVLIGLGVFTTYLANILRTLIIILVGHYYDSDPANLTNLSWAHINLGWIIFMAWIIPFWWLMYRFLMKKDISNENDSKMKP